MPRFAFTKSDRILKRQAFIRISKNGRRFQNRNFIAVVQPNSLNRCRLGITVTRRVGNAVARNRIKRLAREYFRINRQKISANLDIVLIAKQQRIGLTNRQIRLSLDNIFAKIC